MICNRCLNYLELSWIWDIWVKLGPSRVLKDLCTRSLSPASSLGSSQSPGLAGLGWGIGHALLMFSQLGISFCARMCVTTLCRFWMLSISLPRLLEEHNCCFCGTLSTVGHMPRRLDPIVRLEMGCNPRRFPLKRTAKSELMCKREGSIRLKERFKNTLVLGKGMMGMQGAQMGTELIICAAWGLTLLLCHLQGAFFLLRRSSKPTHPDTMAWEWRDGLWQYWQLESTSEVFHFFPLRRVRQTRQGHHHAPASKIECIAQRAKHFKQAWHKQASDAAAIRIQMSWTQIGSRG